MSHQPPQSGGDRVGHEPRRGAAMRGRLASPASVNHERHDLAQFKAEHTRKMDQLCHALVRYLPLSPGNLITLANRNGRGDVNAGQLHDHITATEKVACTQCQYDLRGLAGKGYCPECGARYSFSAGVLQWPELAAILASVLDLPLGAVDMNLPILATIRRCGEDRVARSAEDEFDDLEIVDD